MRTAMISAGLPNSAQNEIMTEHSMHHMFVSIWHVENGLAVRDINKLM